jgi:hypothetical protein
MSRTKWITSVKPGDVIKVGDVVIRVIADTSGRLRLVFEVPAKTKISKLQVVEGG